MENLREVAIKVHHLNSLWSEQQKDKYTKHVCRESEALSEIVHRNIVRLYDKIDIDQHSFASVLEYCDGMVVKREKGEEGRRVQE